MFLFINECLVGAAFNIRVCSNIHVMQILGQLCFICQLVHHSVNASLLLYVFAISWRRIYEAGCILIVSCFIYFGVLCTMMRSGVCLTLTHESMTGFYLVGALQATFLLEGHQSLQ
jgi:hypothetical protein